MSRSPWTGSFFAGTAAPAVALFLVLASPLRAGSEPAPGGASFTAIPAAHHDLSPPLRDFIPAEPPPSSDGSAPRAAAAPFVSSPESVQGRTPNTMPAPLFSANGLDTVTAACNCAPPDPGGEAGRDQYVHVANMAMVIFPKDGGPPTAPVSLKSLWTGFNGTCGTSSWVYEPIVLYDQLAGRWVIGAAADSSDGPTDFCIAVSQTEDAAGSYYRYDFPLGPNTYIDSKLGVWPDGYYLSAMVYVPGGPAYLGAQVFALERSSMLAGTAARMVTPGLFAGSSDYLLPADLDGSLLPHPDAVHPWLATDLATWRLYRFSPDFETPANSSWSLAGSITPSAYTILNSAVPQKNVTQGLESLADRPMFRLAYRRFADGHDALVSTFTVASGGVAALRWMEIQNAAVGTPAILQEGTWQPDSTWRWLGSAAMDTQGNLAIGFSASSSSIFPEIRYAGRLAGDVAGTLGQGEATLHAGAGSQTLASGRWGSHSHLAIDPVDDCTFWYTNEYYPTTTNIGWRTRIGAFKFPDCVIEPTFALRVQPAHGSVCAPSAGTFAVLLTALGGFANPVTLSSSGQPAGTAVSFNPNPAGPGGASVLLLDTTAGAAPGRYTLEVRGSATATDDRWQEVTVDLATGLPPAPPLLAPADGATGQPVEPLFSWTPSSPATYTLEIAYDAGFTSIVHSVSGLAGASYSAPRLDTGTRYYWRLRGENGCGTGADSAVRSFTTQAGPGDCPPESLVVTSYREGFESGAGGWTHSGTGDTWSLSTARPHGGLQSFFAADPSAVTDQRLVSPPIAIPPAELARFRFWNWQHLETRTGGCYDGGILEISTDDGASWTQLVAPTLLTDPYDGPVASGYSNPLAGLPAWCGNNPQPYLDSSVDVTAWTGQTVRFRFRLGSDNSTAKPGWYVDDVRLQTCTPATIFSDGFESGALGAWTSHIP